MIYTRGHCEEFMMIKKSPFEELLGRDESETMYQKNIKIC